MTSPRSGLDRSLEVLTAAEITTLFGLVLEKPVALAVSGGPDSMALMHMVACLLDSQAHRSQARRVTASAAPVIVLTVDHQLRPQSGAEAEFVKSEAARLGFPHRTLRWHGDKPATGMQAGARAARYALMSAAITEEFNSGGPRRLLLTAHHADDQAETFLMRLARGSGASGLAGMRVSTSINDMEIWRPLLGVSKDRLVLTLAHLGATACDDPSNANTDFERVRLRLARPHLQSLGLVNERLALTAKRLARADDALVALTRNWAQTINLNCHGGAYASLNLTAFRAGLSELRVRLLTELLYCNGGDSSAARLSQIEDLDQQICSTSAQGAATLGGCHMRWRQNTGALQVFREEGQRGLPQSRLQPGDTVVWDRRFRVGLGASLQSGSPGDSVTVRALGAGAYATLRSSLPSPIPALAGAALPAFFCDDLLIAVPYFLSQDLKSGHAERRAEPLCMAEALIETTIDAPGNVVPRILTPKTWQTVRSRLS